MPARALDTVADREWLAILCLAALAVLLAICSEADAFVAAGLSQFSQMIVLVMVGFTMLRSTVDGTYLYYVKPGLGPFLLVAAVAFLVLGLIQAFWLVVPSKRPDRPGTPSCASTHQHGKDDPDEHGAAHVPRVAWLLALPVLVMVVVAPATLGSFDAERDSGVIAEPRRARRAAGS